MCNNKIILLLANQRTGTGALGTILDQTPQYAYLGEVLHPNNVNTDEFNYWRFLNAEVKSCVFEDKQINCIPNLEAYLSFIQSKTQGKTPILDIKYDQTHIFNTPHHSPLTTPTLLLYFINQGYPIIHHKRDNLLKMFVSAKLAEMNNIWHASKNDNLQHNRIAIETKGLVQHLNYVKRIVSYFDSQLSGYIKTINTKYEDLFVSKENDLAVYNLCNQLNVNKELFKGIEPVWIKQTSDELREVLINYDDVFECLSGTEYIKFI
jgi:hypothetical protein